MKYVLMAFQPKWLALIMNLEKKTEIRLRIPECLINGEPITVLGYCTKGLPWLAKDLVDYDDFDVAKTDVSYDTQFDIGDFSKVISGPLNGLISCKFVVEKYTELKYGMTEDHFGEVDGGPLFDVDTICKDACLDSMELSEYLGDSCKNGYALPITDLVIFSKPKELNEFYHWNPKKWNGDTHWFPVTRAPQSWMYIADPQMGVGK